MKNGIKKIKINLEKNVELLKFSKFHTGGRADYMFFPQSIEELISGIKYFNENSIDFYVIGEGSNILIHDDGFRGVVIKLKGKKFNFMTCFKDKIQCGAAVKNNVLAKYALKNELSGLEFLCGFPGTIGGSINGNAGNKFGEAGYLIHSINGINNFGEKKSYLKDEIKFDYRNTLFPESIIITDVIFSLNKSSFLTIEELMKKIINERKISDPKGKTCGSVFKNPKNIKAWQIIEKLGFRGAKNGDAIISDKHLNWIINKGKAKSDNIWNLINLIRDEALKKTGIDMELELKLLGNFIKK